MPQQPNRISYPCSMSMYDSKGRPTHKHKVAWLTAIVTKRGERRMFLMANLPGIGRQVFWISVPVADKMLQYLVDKTQKPLRGLSIKEKAVLYEKSIKERIKPR